MKACEKTKKKGMSIWGKKVVYFPWNLKKVVWIFPWWGKKKSCTFLDLAHLWSTLILISLCRSSRRNWWNLGFVRWWARPDTNGLYYLLFCISTHFRIFGWQIFAKMADAFWHCNLGHLHTCQLPNEGIYYYRLLLYTIIATRYHCTLGVFTIKVYTFANIKFG